MTILSTITGLYTGISTEVYKWVAIVGAIIAIAAGSFLWGEHLGASSVAEKQLQQDVKAQQQVAAQQKVQTITDTTVVLALQQQLDGLTAEKQSLQARVKTLQDAGQTMVLVPQPIPPSLAADGTVTVPPVPTAGPVICELSPQSIEIYNESIGFK